MSGLTITILELNPRRTDMNDSEKKILAKIKRWLGKNDKRYDFEFTYQQGLNIGWVAIGWVGGTELTKINKFRNQYSITPYSLHHNRKTIKNW